MWHRGAISVYVTANMDNQLVQILASGPAKIYTSQLVQILPRQPANIYTSWTIQAIIPQKLSYKSTDLARGAI